jgi:hypothetical protein
LLNSSYVSAIPLKVGEMKDKLKKQFYELTKFPISSNSPIQKIPSRPARLKAIASALGELLMKLNY